MNVALWVAQVLLALVFGLAGILKAAQPKEKLAPRLRWVDDFAPPTVRLIGALEVLAALGLILPGVTGIATILTPMAATGLVIIMVLAAVVHGQRQEPSGIVTNVILSALAIFVAWSRFGPWHL